MPRMAQKIHWNPVLRCSTIAAGRHSASTKEQIMCRKIAGPEEIRDHVQRLVNTIPEIVEDNEMVNVPLPQRQEPDADGCNWDMKSFAGARDYDHNIRTLLEQVRQTYNLPDQ